jgi:hypothetical protein
MYSASPFAGQGMRDSFFEGVARELDARREEASPWVESDSIVISNIVEAASRESFRQVPDALRGPWRRDANAALLIGTLGRLKDIVTEEHQQHERDQSIINAVRFLSGALRSPDGTRLSQGEFTAIVTGVVGEVSVAYALNRHRDITLLPNSLLHDVRNGVDELALVRNIPSLEGAPVLVAVQTKAQLTRGGLPGSDAWVPYANEEGAIEFVGIQGNERRRVRYLPSGNIKTDSLEALLRFCGDPLQNMQFDSEAVPVMPAGSRLTVPVVVTYRVAEPQLTGKGGYLPDSRECSRLCAQFRDALDYAVSTLGEKQTTAQVRERKV